MEIRSSLQLIEKRATHSWPILLLASDFSRYWTKFPSPRTDTIDLIYEYTAKIVGDHFGLPIPPVALIKAEAGSFRERDYPWLKVGSLGFGSQEVLQNDALSQHSALIRSKHDFNCIQNPLDLIRIAIFDLHMANTDRSDANFNLLLKRGSGDQIIAIDHAQIFKGPNYKNDFKAVPETSIGNSVLRTNYGHSILKYIDQSYFKAVLQDYENRLPSLAPKLARLKQSIPEEWALSPELHQRISEFLLNEERWDSIARAFRRFFGFL
ncbi:HipA family kinase [Croceimicrobium hydrocarbonivorans]|uniref:HipA-like kinase domain-containing protein n=1 Tax=Croceimicrobium hydrocarbonivorans TaxID=2761580 RepID=A0A7H0VE30_9FLAO|nr:HipA family kinase [Croceimicrobium hydrocarbonivorans]QNR23978.1 hypothetical protein H4K34_16635 [Croceimicrobium hydrocarbonivorans]